MGRVHVLVVRPHRVPVRSFLKRRGSALRGTLRWEFYDRAAARRRPTPGCWIFADLECLDGEGRAAAIDLHDRLARDPGRYLVLNDPASALPRAELQRRLGGFRVAPADAPPDAVRFPVFLRGAGDHDGPLTGLLPDAAALHDARATLPPRAGTVAVEFVDTRGDDGLYRKYSVFRIGDTLVARHVFFSRHWMVKTADVAGDAQVGEELAFLDANPHADAVRDAFDVAGLEYGRIDYAVRAGRPVVWEINTNPMIMSSESDRIAARRPVQERVAPRLVDAFRALARRAPAPRPAWWKALRR